MLKKIVLIFLFFVFSEFLIAQVVVTSTVRTKIVSLQGRLNFTISVQYDSQKNITNPRLPHLKNFNILETHQSYEVQYVNGVTSKKKRFTYVLLPLKAGKFTIGSVEVIVDGKLYKTDPIKIEVSATLKPRPQGSPFTGIGGSLGGFFPSIFNRRQNLLPQKTYNKKDFLFTVETNKSVVYIGEMIIAKWFFYSPYKQSLQIQSEIIKNANLDGFWVETIKPLNSKLVNPSKLSVVNNKKYHKQLFTSSALFAVRKGILKIGFMEVKNYIVNTFAFFNPTRSFSQKSNIKTLKVLSLPQNSTGSFFTQAVGDFNISATVNKHQGKVKNPIIYKIHFVGKGSPRLIRIPKFNFGNNLEIYDTTETQKFSVLKSTKTFEIILIPKSIGDINIPSFELTSFDPDLGIYKTHILPSVKLNILKNDTVLNNNKQIVTQKLNNSVVNLPTKKLIYPWVQNKNIKLWLNNKHIFWMVIYSLLFLVVLFIIGKKLYFKEQKKLLTVLLKQHLKKVEKIIQKQDWKQAGIMLNQIIYMFFSELSQSSKGAKNWDNLFDTIPPSIKIKYEAETKELINLLEKVSFASAEEAKSLRNKKSIESLKTTLIHLLKKIELDYSYLDIFNKKT